MVATHPCKVGVPKVGPVLVKYAQVLPPKRCLNSSSETHRLSWKVMPRRDSQDTEVEGWGSLSEGTNGDTGHGLGPARESAGA